MRKTGSQTMNPRLLQPSPELIDAQALMPMDSGDRQRLFEDIEKNGIRDAIKCYSDKNGDLYILGGYNRWMIAKKLGLKVPVDVYEGTKQEYREIVITDNLNRRHLTTKQKQQLIDYFLGVDHSQSNRAIAKKTGTHHTTVSTRRKKKETTGEISQLKERIGRDGKTRKVPQEEGPADVSRDPEGVTVQITLNSYELAILEWIVSKALNGEYETPAKKQELKSIQRKFSQVRRGAG